MQLGMDGTATYPAALSALTSRHEASRVSINSAVDVLAAATSRPPHRRLAARAAQTERERAETGGA